MGPPADQPPDRTSSAVPAELRAYSEAAVQIDKHIHQLALRLGRVLDAYRATKPEFGRPIPRIEDDLERYAQRCVTIDRRVGRVADAFEHAGSAPQGGSGAASSQPVVAAEAAIAAALEEAQRAAAAETAKPAPPPPKNEEHHDHGLLGVLIHAVDHPGDTLSHAASAVEHGASDALGTVEHAAGERLHDLGAAGASLVHGFKHPGETLDATASGLEKAAGEVAGFGGHVIAGTESAGGGVLHAIEHPAETLAAGEALAEGVARNLAGGTERVASDVAGGLETAGSAVLDATEHPGATAAALLRGTEHAAAADLQGLEMLGGEILHAIEHPWDTLSNAEQAAEDFVTGFATGARDMAQAAMLLARVIPGTPMWMASMAVDPEGTVKLQEQFAKGLAHMVEHPVDSLGNMIDITDLLNGNYAKWLGHVTPDVIVTVLTTGAGGAAAAGEGLADTAAEDVTATLAKDAATTAAKGTAKSAAEDSASLRSVLLRPAPKNASEVWEGISSPDGDLIGFQNPRARPTIHEVRGSGLEDAAAYYRHVAGGGRDITKPGTDGMVELPDGSVITFRAISRTGPPTIDFNLVGRGHYKLKFVGRP
ncbi:MAG: hypothetical protein QOE72_2219 [Chloroflexota bacterium]|jgi:hypothetical protein|nr:hypothetical protein [Chloroflexota bacterium]